MITCEDILWECVRRNLNYKSDYERYIFNPASSGLNELWFRLKWGLSNVIDPGFTVHDILKKRENGSFDENTHPYYNYFKEEYGSVVEIPIPSLTYADMLKIRIGREGEDLRKEVTDWALDVIPKFFGKSLLAYNPLAPKSETVKLMKEVREIAKLRIKNSLHDRIDFVKKSRSGRKRENTVDDEAFSIQINRKDLYCHLDWLELYDEIINRISKRITNLIDDSDTLKVRNGCLVFRKSYKLNEIIWNSEVVSKMEVTIGYNPKFKKNGREYNIVKNTAQEALLEDFQRAYENASEMIRAVPFRIHFSPAK